MPSEKLNLRGNKRQEFSTLTHQLDTYSTNKINKLPSKLPTKLANKQLADNPLASFFLLFKNLKKQLKAQNATKQNVTKRNVTKRNTIKQNAIKKTVNF